MLAVALLVGLLTGLALGALGGGGSILALPALVYLLDQSPHEATTGSLMVVGVTALVGMTSHWRAGHVRVAQGVAFGALGVVGSYVGSRLSARVDEDLLLAGFAALLLLAAAAMARRASRDRAAAVTAAAPPAHAVDGPRPSRSSLAVLERPVLTRSCALPTPSPRLDTCRAVKVGAAATLVGLLTGFFGVGGGFVIVPALVLALGYQMPVAIGTSLLVIAMNSFTALAARIGSDVHLDWPVLGLFTATAIAGSVIGQRAASRVDAARLTFAFTALLVVVAGYTAVRAVPHLG